jgi:hypothetical protein
MPAKKKLKQTKRRKRGWLVVIRADSREEARLLESILHQQAWGFMHEAKIRRG